MGLFSSCFQLLHLLLVGWVHYRLRTNVLTCKYYHTQLVPLSSAAASASLIWSNSSCSLVVFEVFATYLEDILCRRRQSEGLVSMEIVWWTASLALTQQRTWYKHTNWPQTGFGGDSYTETMGCLWEHSFFFFCCFANSSPGHVHLFLRTHYYTCVKCKKLIPHHEIAVSRWNILKTL